MVIEPAPLAGFLAHVSSSQHHPLRSAGAKMYKVAPSPTPSEARYINILAHVFIAFRISTIKLEAFLFSVMLECSLTNWIMWIATCVADCTILSQEITMNSVIVEASRTLEKFSEVV